LRAFFVDGQLTAIPAQEKKRQVILRYLAETVFVPNVAYPEKEVNQRLAVHHPDVASLRRYLLEWRYMRREAGGYQRCPEGVAAGSGRLSRAACPRPEPSPPAVGRVATSHGRLDQPVVAIASPVEDRDVLVLGIDEHEEGVPELLHAGHSILLEHRLDGEALDLDHRGPDRGRVGRAIGDRTQEVLLLERPMMPLWLLRVLPCPSFELVDDLVGRRLRWVAACAIPRNGRPSMTRVTSTMWLSSTDLWRSSENSAWASERSSSSRSRRLSLRSAYARSASGTSRFLPLTMIRTSRLLTP
jgi:hypothetical protein